MVLFFFSFRFSSLDYYNFSLRSLAKEYASKDREKTRGKKTVKEKRGKKKNCKRCVAIFLKVSRSRRLCLPAFVCSFVCCFCLRFFICTGLVPRQSIVMPLPLTSVPLFSPLLRLFHFLLQFFFCICIVFFCPQGYKKKKRR